MFQFRYDPILMVFARLRTALVVQLLNGLPAASGSGGRPYTAIQS